MVLHACCYAILCVWMRWSCDKSKQRRQPLSTPAHPLWLSRDVKSGFQQDCARLHTQYGRMQLLHWEVVVCFPRGCILQVQSAGRRYRLIVDQSIRCCVHLHQSDPHCHARWATGASFRSPLLTRTQTVLRLTAIPLELHSQRLRVLRLCLELPLHGLRPRRCMRQ